MLAVQVLLQDVYHTQPGVSCLILKLAADIVEAHISYAQVASPCVLPHTHSATWLSPCNASEPEVKVHFV